MSCLSWNYRGLGNPHKKDELVTLVRNKVPRLIFLMETKVEKSVLAKIGRKLQYANLFEVPPHKTGVV